MHKPTHTLFSFPENAMLYRLYTSITFFSGMFAELFPVGDNPTEEKEPVDLVEVGLASVQYGPVATLYTSQKLGLFKLSPCSSIYLYLFRLISISLSQNRIGFSSCFSSYPLSGQLVTTDFRQ